MYTLIYGPALEIAELPFDVVVVVKMFSYKIILPSAASSACKSVAQSCSGPKIEVLKIPGPLIVNESEMHFLLLSLHAPLIQQCRMKQMNVADINLPPTLLLSVRIIR